VGLAMIIAGCGHTPLSISQLRGNASRICSSANARINRIPTPASPGGEATFLKRGIRVLTPELAQLRTLRPTSDLVGDYVAALDAFSQKLGALNGAVRSLNERDDPVFTAKALQRRLAPIEDREDGAWQALKIPACVNQ
jgi:hypothetical protein